VTGVATASATGVPAAGSPGAWMPASAAGDTAVAAR
jgi:hypothetical protein